MNYIDQNCPCCGMPFKETDDIVVCPECGTPHHRACYDAAGECANSKLHASGFQWENTGNGEISGTEERRSTVKVTCPKCGNQDCTYNSFCENCGHYIAEPLISADEAPADLPDSFDGIPTEQLRDFIRRNTDFYLYHFDAMDRKHRKAELNTAGFLFPSFYYFYRKMNQRGLISVLLMTALSLPSYICALLSERGAGLGILSTVSVILLALSLLYRVYTALFSISHYRAHCSKLIKNSAEGKTAEENGGTSLLSVVILIAALTILALVINLII